MESSASIEYLMDNNIFHHILSQTTVQPFLYEPQIAAAETRAMSQADATGEDVLGDRKVAGAQPNKEGWLFQSLYHGE